MLVEGREDVMDDLDEDDVEAEEARSPRTLVVTALNKSILESGSRLDYAQVEMFIKPLAMIMNQMNSLLLLTVVCVFFGEFQ